MIEGRQQRLPRRPQCKRSFHLLPVPEVKWTCWTPFYVQVCPVSGDLGFGSPRR